MLASMWSTAETSNAAGKTQSLKTVARCSAGMCAKTLRSSSMVKELVALEFVLILSASAIHLLHAHLGNIVRLTYERSLPLLATKLSAVISPLLSWAATSCKKAGTPQHMAAS